VGGVETTTVVGTPAPVQLSGAQGEDLFTPSFEDGPDVEEGDLAEAWFDSIVIDGGDADLSFLDTVTISVAAPGLMQEVVAVSEGGFDGPGPFALTLMDVDLAPYIETGAMSLPASLVGMTPEQDTQLHVDWSVVLGVTAQGVVNAAESGAL